jgi:O-antigen/teichoic acid export membrane protein
MNGQGITILLNAFGTVVIAARGIAGSISGFVYNFVGSFQSAVRPQIFKLFSVNDLQGMNKLVIRTSKFSSYLMAFIGIPLFIEMDYVLNLWLDEVPEYTVIFARLALIQGLIQAIDLPIGAGIHAVGKMKLPNLTSAFIYMAILPISYFIIRLGASPSIVYVVLVSVYPMAFFMDLYIIKKYTQFPVSDYLCRSILPSLAFIIVTYFITISVVGLLSSTFMRVVFTTIVSSAIFIPLVYFLGLTSGERVFVNGTVMKKLKLKKANRFTE